MKNFLLFAVSSLIWGSTWLVIKFQLGVVDPIVSVAYRFFLAAFILLLFCHFYGMRMKYSVREHLFIALQGLFLFGINYWLVYIAEQTLTSGLVAVVFSTIIFLNIFNGNLLLKSPVRKTVFIGAIVGFLGVGLIFKDEVFSFSLSSGNTFAFAISFLAAIIASLGNITSAYNQKSGLPVIPTNAFGMLYGAIMMLVISLILGKPLTFDLSFAYISSMIYLSIFGSIVAFSTYLTLLGKIGADKSAYVTLVIPVIALILSTIFENYQWTIHALLGVLFILTGNIIVLRRKKKLT